MKRLQFIRLILVVVTFLAFFSVYSNEFVSWDDYALIVNDPYVNPPEISNIPHFWQTPHQKLYIPLTYTLWIIIGLFSGASVGNSDSIKLQPQLFHASNLIFYIGSVLVVFSILRIVTKKSDNSEDNSFRRDWASALGALMFALHPIHVEPVAWATGTKDILCGFFSLLAIWQYLLFVTGFSKPDTRNTLNYSVAFFFFILALFSKPSAVVVPVMLWILDYFFFKRPLKKTILHLIPWIVCTTLIVFITKAAQPASAIYTPAPLSRIIVAGDTIAFYLYKFFLPFSLCIDYGRSPEFLLNQKWSYFTPLIPLVFALLIGFRKERRLFLISYGVFVVGILPVSGIVPFVFQALSTVADRYLFLSLLGPSIALAGAMTLWGSKKVVAVVTLSLCILGIKTIYQVGYWKDTKTLINHVLKINPSSYMAHYNRGVALALEKDFGGSLIYYKKALEIKEDFMAAHINLGVLLAMNGKLDDSISHFSRALELSPNDVEGLFNMGMAMEQKKYLEKAEIYFRRALEVNPDFLKGRKALSRIMRKKNSG